MMIRAILLVVFFTSIVCLPTTTKDPNEIAINYLTKYGYMSENEKASEIKLITGALKKMQEFAGIQITGELDQATLAVMLTPRCSLPDESSGTFANKFTWRTYWNKKKLTYKIKNYPSYQIGLSENSMVDKLIAQSFKDWSDVADLKFTKVRKNQYSDIVLSFEPKYHGDGEPFDEDTIAHAFYPPVGLVHFNDDLKWTSIPQIADGFYLRQITTHELGHSLGLGHSKIIGSLMYPIYFPDASEYIMHQDDMDGIVYLYGAKKQTSTTKVTTSKVIDDESTIFQQTTFRSVQTTTSTAVSFSMTTSTAQTSLPDPNFSITEVTTSKIMDDKSTLVQPTTLRSVEKSTKLSTASIMAVVEKWILMLPTIMYFLC